MLKLDNNALLRDAAYIDGEWRGARLGARFAVKNPATGEVIAEVADLDETDVKAAIEAANRAWGPWRAKTAKERAVLMRKWYELMMAAQEDLAQLMTAEQGKATGREPRRGRLWRLLHRMVRRRGQAHLWRCDSQQRRGPPHRRDEGARRRSCRHHAMEFP